MVLCYTEIWAKKTDYLRDYVVNFVLLEQGIIYRSIYTPSYRITPIILTPKL